MVQFEPLAFGEAPTGEWLHFPNLSKPV